MTGFETRQQLEAKQALAFEAMLRHLRYQFIRCGIETDGNHVHKNNPDYLTISPTGKVCFVELKNCPVISKNSYEYCLKLDKRTPVFFVLSSQGRAEHREDRFYVARASSLVFKTASDMTGSPDMLPGSDVWRIDHKGGSGQPYGIVDLSKAQEMKGLTITYQLVSRE